MLKRPKIKKPFLLILSHKNSQCRDIQHLKIKSQSIAYNFYYYYFIGDINLKQNYFVDEVNKIVYLKVPDNYESLSLKVYESFRFINDNFEDICGVFKTDDDIDLDLNKIFKLNTTYSNFDYYGLKNEIVDDYSFYHFGKCENDILNNLPMKTPITCYCSGGGYYLNAKNIKYVLSSYKIFSTIIYEDVAVGHVLSTNGIKLINVDVKNNGFSW
jgi:hypothetical protein